MLDDAMTDRVTGEIIDQRRRRVMVRAGRRIAVPSAGGIFSGGAPGITLRRTTRGLTSDRPAGADRWISDRSRRTLPQN